MTYYLVLVQQYNDGTDVKKSLYTYDSYAECIGNFHSYLGSAMKASNISKATLVAFDENGNIKMHECYTAETETESEE